MMTTLKFTFWLVGLYFIYYAIVILWDLAKANRNGARQGGQELTFAESFTPVQPEFQLATDDLQPAAVASGGVILKQLFILAQDEKIEFTSQVSF